MTEPVTPAAAPAAPDNPAEPKRTPRRLGEIEGFAVMLLYSRQGVPFYKLAGASPKEFTGTVSDPENPTLSDALRALLNSMKREATKGLGFSGKDFRPTMKQVVAAARLEKDFIEQPDGTGPKDSMSPTGSAAPKDAGSVTPGEGSPANVPQNRRPRGLRTLCARNSVLLPRCSGEPEPVAEPGERDTSVTVTDAERDSVTVTEVSRPESVTSPANSSEDKDLRQRDTSVTVTLAAPSSSSSSLNDERNENKDTTTTRATADHERDAHADQGDDFSRYLKAAGKPDELDRYLTASGCLPTLTPEQAALVQRLADALGTTPEAVREQGRNRPAWLAARCHAAGIDPKTGFPMAARAARAGDHAPTSPQDAPGSPSGTGTGVQSVSSGQASSGIGGAPATTTPTGEPDDVDALGSRLSHGLTTVTARLRSDDHAEDADHDAGHDADQERRRAEALQAIADFQRDAERDSDGKPALRLTEPVG